MGSDYVDIRTSPVDILSAANNLVSMGGELETDMTGLVGDIESQEGTSTWGSDDFATKFLDGYHKVPDGADKPVAEATKDLGRGKHSIGTQAQDLGNFVANAMLNISDQDEGSGSEIRAVPT